MGCLTTGTSSRGSSRTSFLGIGRCAAGARLTQGRLGHARGCPSRSRVEKELRTSARPPSRRTASSRSSKCTASSRSSGTSEWEELTERVGFWVDLNDAYVTYHRSYVEQRLVVTSQAAQKGCSTPGTQGRLVVGAGRHRAVVGRGRAGVQAGRRSERVRRVPNHRSRLTSSHSIASWSCGRSVPAGVDDDPVDCIAVEHVRGRERADSRLRRRKNKGRSKTCRPAKGAR